MEELGFGDVYIHIICILGVRGWLGIDLPFYFAKIIDELVYP